MTPSEHHAGAAPGLRAQVIVEREQLVVRDAPVAFLSFADFQ